MYIGSGIFLLVAGAIMAFAVRDSLDAIDLTMIGYICMGAGALAIVLSFLMRGSNGSDVSSRRVRHTDPNTGATVDETDVHRDGL